MRLIDLKKYAAKRYAVTTRGGMPLSFAIPHDSRLCAEIRAFLESTAGQDPLTGLANSHVFAALAEQEIVRSLRHNRPMALIMLKVDDSGETSDLAHPWMYGPGLRALVAVVYSQLRKPDRMARMGDSTFVILLPETSCPEAISLAESLRSALHSQRPLPGKQPFPFARIGVAALGDKTRCLEDLIQQAVPQ